MRHSLRTLSGLLSALFLDGGQVALDLLHVVEPHPAVLLQLGTLRPLCHCSSCLSIAFLGVLLTDGLLACLPHLLFLVRVAGLLRLERQFLDFDAVPLSPARVLALDALVTLLPGCLEIRKILVVPIRWRRSLKGAESLAFLCLLVSPWGGFLLFGVRVEVVLAHNEQTDQLQDAILYLNQQRNEQPIGPCLHQVSERASGCYQDQNCREAHREHQQTRGKRAQTHQDHPQGDPRHERWRLPRQARQLL